MTAIASLYYFASLLALFAMNSNSVLLIDDYGRTHVIDKNEPVFTQTELNQIHASAKNITFHLYTRKNPQNGQQLFIDDLISVKNSSWNPDHPTRLITHGWRGDCEQGPCLMIRDAYLSVGDYNVILIDWWNAANVWYWEAAKSVPFVAQRIAFLLDFLENNAALDPNTTTIIGHSLGAHVAGLSARFTMSEIAEVVALDPAHIAFKSKGPGQRVDKSDAVLVEVIHTCTKGVGIKAAIGTSDFYPNGGEEQPGCGSIRWFGDVTAIGCAHSRAFLYYAESVMNPKGFRAGDVFMGGSNLDPNARGIYILQTASKEPFALG